MNNIITVPILTELSPQQVYLMKLLESLRVFDIKNGSVTIHFNGTGQIVNIEKKEHYKV